MPFPFSLPTTSHLTLQTRLISSTHPSLPANATSTRNFVRSGLKAHKQLPQAQQSGNLNTLLNVLNEYIPYLLTLDAGLSGRPVSGESIDVTLLKEIEVEWRPTLSSSASLLGRDSARVLGKGLDFEIYSVLQALATVHSLLGRVSVLKLYAPSSSASDSYSISSSQPRTLALQTASKHFVTAHSIHNHLLHLTNNSTDGTTAFPAEAVDVQAVTQSCLAELSITEATLLFVFKDDPYPALLQQSRDKNDREWMVKAPEVPQVRAHLFARLCFGAAEHASKAAGSARSARGDGSKGLTKDLVTYCEDLRMTARARGCRFLGLDSESVGKTGEGIAWLRAGMNELGIEAVAGGDSGTKISLSRLKASWTEKKEERNIEKGRMQEWGSDAGKSEEGRILEWLEKKWTKQNDTVNVQLIPDHKTLSDQIPSGREAFSSGLGTWVPKLLDEETLARMRTPLERRSIDEDPSSGDDDAAVRQDREKGEKRAPAGAFPGTRAEYDGGYY